LGIGFQPSDMSLEEIESRIGVLLEPDVITNLKSVVRKESLDGWSEKNVQISFKFNGSTCKKYVSSTTEGN